MAFNPGWLRLERDDLGVLDVERDVDSRDFEVAVQVHLVRAARAGADALAVEIVCVPRRGGLGDEVVVRHGVVRLGHVQPLHPVGVDRARAVGDVEPVAPVAGRDLGPGRGCETRLDPEPLGDELRRVGVEALDLIRGELRFGALRIGETLGTRNVHRLRRVVGLVVADERAAREHLRELVRRRICRRRARRVVRP